MTKPIQLPKEFPASIRGALVLHHLACAIYSELESTFIEDWGWTPKEGRAYALQLAIAQVQGDHPILTAW